MYSRVFLAFVVTWLCSVGGNTTTTSPVTKPEDLFEHDAEATQIKFNYFDAALLKELGDQEQGNFVVSPASIKTLLALVLEGSEGSTQAELLRVLRLPQNMTYARQALSSLQNSLQKTTNSKVTVDSVAHIFIASTLKTNSTYKKTVKDHYRADVSPQDFTSPEVATNNINSWIRTRTGALISDLVDQAMITADTFAMLTSAIYFDGKWKTEFPSQNTEDECFFSEPSLQCQMVPMMAKNEDMFYKFDQSLDSHVLQMPYQDERFSMVVVMPRKMDGMKQLTVDSVRLSFPHILNRMNEFEVKLKMPRFSMDYGNELIPTLQKLGVHQAFADNAQLPYMIHGRQSRVGAIVHKAKIDVNEKGTKAAAASAAALVPLMFGSGVIELELNHPFFYFVYDKQSKTVLFFGRLSSVGTTATSNQPSATPLGADGLGSRKTFHGAPAGTANQQPNKQQSFSPSVNTVGSNNQQPNAAPTNTAGYNGQASFVAPTNAAGYNGQASFAAPTNAGGFNGQPTYASQANTVGSNNQQPYAAPANAVAYNGQASYAAPTNAGSDGQPTYASPANTVGSNGQPSYAAPPNTVGSNSRPSYANVAAGSPYRPTAQMAAAQHSDIETISSAPRPINHGAQNHRYNPQAPTSVPSGGYSYKDIEYPPSSDDSNYANYGSQSQRG